MLNETQRSQLLRIARESIAAVLEGRRPPQPDPETIEAALRRPSGVFVTLNDRQGELRGCIGSIQPVAPLYEAVASSASSAAFRDPRFPPVAPGELESLHLEISVMSPIVPVENVEEIEVGRDGLIVSRGPRAGLLLPQVASEYEWDRETFLRQTCHKAGLPSDAWRQPGTTIEKFSAEVFGE
jgi:AmmeMemoRadiSam system protein A